MNRRILPLLLLLCAVSQPTVAKTLYVETWGSNTGPCAKSDPCNSIRYAVENVAGNNDRIIVGPGTYEGHFTIFQDKLKLVSVAGARGTTIEAGSDISDLIHVTGHRVSIGQKKKGFTLTGNFLGRNAIGESIPGGSNDIRIEDNIFRDLVSSSNFAIDINGGKSTIRYNIIERFYGGINISGYGQDVGRNLVDENRISDVDSEPCIAVGGNDNERNRITDNILTSCGYVGIYLDAASGEKSGDRVQGNSITDAGDIGIEVQGGNPQVRRNSVNGAMDAGIMTDDSIKAQINENLLRNNAIGVEVRSGSEDVTLKANIIQDSTDVALLLSELPDSIQSISRNNIVNYDCLMRLPSAADPGTEISFSKNFFVDASGISMTDPDLGCGMNTTAQDLYDAGRLTFNPSVKPNPVKYKSDL